MRSSPFPLILILVLPTKERFPFPKRPCSALRKRNAAFLSPCPPHERIKSNPPYLQALRRVTAKNGSLWFVPSAFPVWRIFLAHLQEFMHKNPPQNFGNFAFRCNNNAWSFGRGFFIIESERFPRGLPCGLRLHLHHLFTPFVQRRNTP